MSKEDEPINSNEPMAQSDSPEERNDNDDQSAPQYDLQNLEDRPSDRFEQLHKRMQENAAKVDKMIRGSKQRGQSSLGAEEKTPDDSKSPTTATKGDDETKNQASPNKRKAGKAADSIKAAKDKISGGLNQAKEIREGAGAAIDMAKNAPEYTKELAKKKAKEAAKEMTKRLARAAARMAKQLAMQIGRAILSNPVVLAILGIILLIFIIVAVIFALWSYGGKMGKGPEMYPSTQAQINEAQLLAALAGNSLAASEVSNKVIEYEKERYDRLIASLKQYGAPNSEALEEKLKAVQAQLDELKKVYASKNQTSIKNKRKEVLKMMEETEKALPFNDWIARKAIDIWQDAEKSKSSYACKVTGNMVGGEPNVRKACASVVTVILVETGVPIRNCLSTMCLWQNKLFQLVVDRKPVIDRNLAKDKLSVLKPGDLVWWGDGGGSAPAGSLFNHVGIYVGNGEAVDNSSKNARVMKRSLDRKGEQGFNGAKRFVPRYLIDG